MRVDVEVLEVDELLSEEKPGVGSFAGETSGSHGGDKRRREKTAPCKHHQRKRSYFFFFFAVQAEWINDGVRVKW